MLPDTGHLMAPLPAIYVSQPCTTHACMHDGCALTCLRAALQDLSLSCSVRDMHDECYSTRLASFGARLAHCACHSWKCFLTRVIYVVHDVHWPLHVIYETHATHAVEALLQEVVEPIEAPRTVMPMLHTRGAALANASVPVPRGRVLLRFLARVLPSALLRLVACACVIHHVVRVGYVPLLQARVPSSGSEIGNLTSYFPS
jgi:hypothetical protein